MKNSLFAFLLIVISLISCKKEEDNNPTETKSKMLGLWNIVYIEQLHKHYNNVDYTGQTYMGNENSFFLFNDDGEISAHYATKEYNYNYQMIDKNHFNLIDDDETLKCVIEKLDGENFVFTAHQENGPYGTLSTYKYTMKRY